MNILFNAIAPIFLMVIAGFALTKFKLVNHSLASSLMQFVLYAAAPCLVFYAIVSNPLSKLLYWKFWVAYPVSLVIVVVLTFILFKIILRRNLIVSLIAGYCAAVSNTAIIGYPVLSGFIGHVAAIPMSITIIVFMLIMLPLIIFTCELHVQSQKSETQEILSIIKSAIISTLKNPLVIAVIIGVICVVINVKMPLVIMHFTQAVGETLTPCALFAVGIDLAEFKVEGNLLDIILINIMSLIVTPIIAVFVAKLLDLTPLYAVSLVIFASVATAKTIYVLMNKYNIYVKETAAIISTTTICSVVTIPLVTYATKLLWPMVFKQ